MPFPVQLLTLLAAVGDLLVLLASPQGPDVATGMGVDLFHGGEQRTCGFALQLLTDGLSHLV